VVFKRFDSQSRRTGGLVLVRECTTVSQQSPVREIGWRVLGQEATGRSSLRPLMTGQLPGSKVSRKLLKDLVNRGGLEPPTR
jgi:hypothetical protein